MLYKQIMEHRERVQNDAQNIIDQTHSTGGDVSKLKRLMTQKITFGTTHERLVAKAVLGKLDD